MASHGSSETAAPAQRGVRYADVHAGYLDQRQLKKSAGWLSLWALGVGAVISGMYSGWNTGLVKGGFGGLLLATMLMTVMYVCIVYSIAELSAALPHAGGFYSFARRAFGPWGGVLVGISDTIEYVVTPAVIVYFIGGFMQELAPAVPLWIWYVTYYVTFLAFNIVGATLTFRVGLVITLAAVAVLLVFFGAALVSGKFEPALLLNVPPSPGQSKFLPYGAYGIFTALPYAIWFFLAIEQLPLAAEETHDVVRDMPRALIAGILTLVFLAFGTLVLNSGVGGGAVEMGASKAPLPDGFAAIFGQGTAMTTMLTLIALVGLVASFHGTIYAAGRVLFSLSRAGYYPHWISVCGARTQTPHRALLVAGGVGILLAVGAALDATNFGPVLLNMSVFGAVISYGIVMVAFIVLRVRQPDLPRPYRSPLGLAGAAVGLSLTICGLAATLADPDMRAGVSGTAIFFVGAFVYFWLFSSKRLVAAAPEESAALQRT